MANTILETFGTVRTDGTLVMDEKLAVAPGRVKVRVESTEPARESAEDLAARFAKLTAAWKEDTRFSSKAKTMAEHPAYLEIVAMGEKAVPLILRDLEKNGGHWFIGLRKITGASPVPEASRGIVDEMEKAWLEWGRANGYRW